MVVTTKLNNIAVNDFNASKSRHSRVLDVTELVVICTICLNKKQECIPVGCVPSAAVAVCPCRNYVVDGKNIVKYFTDVQHRKRERNRSHSKHKKRSRSSSSSSSTSTDSSSSSETSSSSSSDSSPGKKWISSISIQYIILLLFHIIIIVTYHILLNLCKNCNNNINVMCESLNIQIY